MQIEAGLSINIVFFMKRILSLAFLCSFSLYVFAQESFITHLVKSGETVSSICERYGVSREEFNELNPSVSNFVYVGQELKIPVSSNLSESKKDDSKKPTSDNNEKQKTSISMNNNVVDDYIQSDVVVQTEEKILDTRVSQKTNNDFVLKNMMTPASNSFIGYVLPPEGAKNYLCMSIGLGGGTRYHFSDDLMLEAFLDIYYQFSTVSSSVSAVGYNVKTESSSGDFGVMIPAKFGVSIGDVFYLRAGAFMQLSLFGHVTTKTETKEGKNTQKSENTQRFKDMKDLDRFHYGLCFDATFGDWGIGYSMTYQKGVKEPVKMISLVSYF